MFNSKFYHLLGRYETWSRLYGQFLTSHNCVLSPKTFELMSLFTGMEEWPVVKWREMQLNDGIKHWIRET